MSTDERVQRWTEPTELPPLDIKPHSCSGEQCEFCRKERSTAAQEPKP